MNFKRILVPVDFSSNSTLAFRLALKLAQALDGTLDVLHVQEGSSLRTAVIEKLIRPGMSDEEMATAVSELQEMRFSMLLAGLDTEIPIRCAVGRGGADPVILDYAKQMRAELMVVGLRGNGVWDSLRTGLMGSVAENMVRKSPCPVMVVRPDHRS